MAVMEALLKIKADVQGEGQVNALNRAIGGVGTTAAKVSGTLRGMASGAGNLAGAMGTLTPLLSAGGLVGMAKAALDAGDAMNDLSQRTGISVESLAKFKKAAAVSGTDIESVAKASQKLSKGLYDAATTGKGPAAGALETLGIKATDAAGKVRNADAVMLDIANRFKSMPDGATKTALAMQLFGKAGAEMIPMLNMGGDAIDKLKVKMTAAFAAKADEYNDKLAALSGKVGALGMDLTIALLPALEAVTNAVTGLIDGFNRLPEPIRAIAGGVALLAVSFVALSPIISGVISLATMLSGLGLGATIAGWLGAVGPAIAGMTAALSGLLAWVGGTLIPGLLAFFSGPVGWTVLAVAAVVAMCIAFREPIGKFFSWLGGAIASGLEALWKWSEPIRAFWAGLWQAVYAITWQAFVQPWVNLWNLIKQPLDGFRIWIGGLFSSIWQSLANGARNAFRGVLQFIADRINVVGQSINFLIAAFNRLPGPDIPMVPMLTVPAFAQGGYVNQATLAMVGEAGGEYIIPASRMAQASANFLAGARGDAVLRGGGTAQINVQTGPVLQQDGKQYVTLSDLERAMRITAEGVIGRLRTPAARIALGMS